jgi:hypothetical protein
MLPELLALPLTQNVLGAVLTHDYGTHRHLLNGAPASFTTSGNFESPNTFSTRHVR